MKTIIAGSRSIWDDVSCFILIEQHRDTITEVVSGNAQGPDRYGERWAWSRNVPIYRFIPDWRLHGKAAGIIRNKRMGDYADQLIALWDGESKGTDHMISYMNQLNKPVHLYVVVNTKNKRVIRDCVC